MLEIAPAAYFLRKVVSINIPESELNEYTAYKRPTEILCDSGTGTERKENSDQHQQTCPAPVLADRHRLSVFFMATFQASKRATTLSPTIRSLASGVPVVSRLNLTVRAPVSDHDHGHGGSATRSDSQPKWSGGVDLSSAAGLVSRTVTTSGSNFQSSLMVNLISVCSSSMPLYSFPTTLHPHICCEERYT